MISAPDRQAAVELIEAACQSGARRSRACAELGLHERTLKRWQREGAVGADRRPTAVRPPPRNRLTAVERATVLEICHRPEFASLPPSQIVPRLADQGE